MAVTVCTGMWGPRRLEYAAMFSSAFDEHWSRRTGLVVFSDDKVIVPHWTKLAPIQGIPGYMDFMSRHAGDPVKAGKKPGPGAKWKTGALEKGYNFRYDALRFAGQAFIPEAAAEGLPDGDILVWLDADVKTFADVPESFVEGLIGDADGCYLGRAPKHSEIGFWAVRLHTSTRALLHDFAELYRSDRLFDLREWHSAYAWDHARKELERHGVLDMRNLTPGGSGHVWFQSPLRHHLDHLKGDRKKAGRSRERR